MASARTAVALSVSLVVAAAAVVVGAILLVGKRSVPAAQDAVLTPTPAPTSTAAPHWRTSSSPARTSARPSATRSATPTPTPRPSSTKPVPRATTSTPPRSTPPPVPRTTAVVPPPRPTTPTTPPRTPAGSALPLNFTTGSATQVITVVAPSTGSTTATLQAWEKVSGGWRRWGPSLFAWVGSEGLTSSPSESRSATPIGSFTLTQAFGNQANPGTALPFFLTDGADWWVGDSASSLYNQHARCWSNCPFNTASSEHLRDIGSVYDRAVVIDYNRFPARPGAGSAFFLHIGNGSPTAGCVAIDRGALESIMQWLTPARNPRILIGIG